VSEGQDWKNFCDANIARHKAVKEARILREALETIRDKDVADLHEASLVANYALLRAGRGEFDKQIQRDMEYPPPEPAPKPEGRSCVHRSMIQMEDGALWFCTQCGEEMEPPIAFPLTTAEINRMIDEAEDNTPWCLKSPRTPAESDGEGV
jgi:hypothetical protein